MGSIASFFRNMFTLSPAAALTVLCILAVPQIAIQLALKSRGAAQQSLAQREQVRLHLHHIGDAMISANSAAMRGVLLPGAPDAAKAFEQARQSINEHRSALLALSVAYPDRLEVLNRFERLADAHFDRLRLAVELADQGLREKALQALIRPDNQERPNTALTEFTRLEDQSVADDLVHERFLHRIVWWGGLLGLILQLTLLALWLNQRARREQRERQMQQDREYADQRAGLILKSMRDAVVLVDSDLNIVDANPAFVESYRARPELHQPLRECGDGNWTDEGLLQRLRDVVLQGREIWDFELHQVLEDRTPRIMLINARRIQKSANSSCIVVIRVTDVTSRRRDAQEVKRLNLTLQERIEEALRANRELETLSYSMAHDLRAPLRHVSGYARRLDQSLRDSRIESAHENIAVIMKSVARMAETIDALLHYSQLGQSLLRPTSIDMKAMFEEMRQMVGSERPDSAVHWVVGDLPAATGDASLVRLVWQNLLANAIKFSALKPEPVIEVGVVPETRDGSVPTYFVRDNGAGFDMKHSSKLFGLFQRLHRTGAFPGTGIGLANARRIVERHGGSIWAESTPDSGATFYFTLAARSPAPNTT
jgi:signal transduction histidine kinase/CHASE3 domain sensor protein